MVYKGSSYPLRDRMLYFDSGRDPMVAVNSEYDLDCLVVFSVDIRASDQDQAAGTLTGFLLLLGVNF